MADRAPERTRSPAYLTLRASTRRLLALIEQEIARGGGGKVTLYADQFAVVGSVRVVLPGLSELTGLGLIEWQRFPKRHVCGLSRSLARYRDGKAGDDRQRRCADAAHTAAADAVATGNGLDPCLIWPLSVDRVMSLRRHGFVPKNGGGFIGPAV